LSINYQILKYAIFRNFQPQKIDFFFRFYYFYQYVFIFTFYFHYQVDQIKIVLNKKFVFFVVEEHHNLEQLGRQEA